MQRKVLVGGMLCFLLAAAPAGRATTYYVSPGGSHTEPFDDWSTAANDIASAVALAGPDDTVLLDDGTYSPTDDIVISNPITIQSANGPSACTVSGDATIELFTFNMAGAVLDGLTLRDADGIMVGAFHPATLRGCVIDQAGSLVFSAGSVIDGCTISNVGNIQASSALFTNCTIGSPDFMAPPPLGAHVSFTSDAGSTFRSCTLRGIVRLDYPVAPDVTWDMADTFVEGQLFANGSRLQGSFSGPGALILNGVVIDGATLADLDSVEALGTRFTNCTFSAMPPQALRFSSGIDGTTNVFQACTFEGNVELDYPVWSPTVWIFEEGNIVGQLFAGGCTLQGTFGGGGELMLAGTRVEGCAIPELNRITCANAIFSNCTLGAVGGFPMPPDVSLVAGSDGASNWLYDCTFEGGVHLPGEHADHGTWVIRRGVIHGQVETRAGTIEGDFGGGGTLVGGPTWFRQCTISNLWQFTAHGSTITSSEILYAPMRGMELQDGALLTHSRIHHNGGGVAAVNSTVRNCEIWANDAGAENGGGLWLDAGATVSACTIVENNAAAGGGVYVSDGGAAIDNTIVQFNSAVTDANWHDAGAVTWAYSSSDPGPPGIGNQADDPQFVPSTRLLAAGSPCINAGAVEGWMSGAVDLAGHPRVVNGRPDLGAYEFIFAEDDYDGDGLGNEDEVNDYGTDPDSADTDADGQSDADEVVAGSDPVQAASSFKWEADSLPEVTPEGNVLKWSSLSTRVYTITRASDLGAGFVDTIAASLPATPPLNTYTDTTAAADQPAFYSISVRIP